MMPTCAAGDKVVWVNTRSKVYYEPGGAYYGKTKHGKYVCESQAMSMGMHMAKGGMMSDSNGNSMKHHSGMSDGSMMKHHSGMNEGGSMKSGSMGSGSMGSGSMGSGSMKSGSGAGSSGGTMSGTSSSPSARVTPAPVVSASPSP
ncbi:MAG: hypothetical protein NVSMB19_06170 [Vulcanimicrobiaceae bacterium]